MEIKFHSTVIMTEEFELMKSFYQNILQQQIEFDFGNCIGFKNGLSLWKLKDDYPIAKKLGRTFDNSGNKNLEICFETDDFKLVVESLNKYELKYLHNSTLTDFILLIKSLVYIVLSSAMSFKHLVNHILFRHLPVQFEDNPPFNITG